MDHIAGNDGVVLARAFADITNAASAAQSVGLARGDYVELFHAVIASGVVRRPETRDVRAHIYGPLEARLQSADLLVLGGLNEATWPPETRSDPWLSRPMRRELGLDPPERRIGLSAHDFAQSLGAPEIVLTRAAKLAGAPTVTTDSLQLLPGGAGADAGPIQGQAVITFPGGAASDGRRPPTSSRAAPAARDLFETPIVTP